MSSRERNYIKRGKKKQKHNLSFGIIIKTKNLISHNFKNTSMLQEPLNNNSNNNYSN